MYIATAWVFNDGHPEKHFRKPLASMFQEGTYCYSTYTQSWSVVKHITTMKADWQVGFTACWNTVENQNVPKEYRAMLLLLL